MEWNTTVEELLRSKDFSELSAEQEQAVLRCMSEPEYQAFRDLVLAGKSLAGSPKPPHSIQRKLQQAFRKKHKRRNLPLHTISFPLWQAAAAAALFLLLGQALHWAPVHATPSAAALSADSIWLNRLSDAMKDTVSAIFPAMEGRPDRASSQRLAWQEQDSVREPVLSPADAQLLPEPAVDTPGWARRSAVMDQAYLQWFYQGR